MGQKHQAQSQGHSSIGERPTDATARVLDRHADRKLWGEVAAIANRKYGWGDGLPVEITPTANPE
jgi:hypothetical protein